MDLLTVHETATMLRLSPKTVRQYINTGRLPAVRVGRRVRVERAAAQALATPIQPKPVQHGRGPQAEHSDLGGSRPLTNGEVAEALRAIEEAEAFAKVLQGRRDGALFDESWPLIREAREERP